MVYLVVANVSRPYTQSFKWGGIMDATVVLYTMVYFAIYGYIYLHRPADVWRMEARPRFSTNVVTFPARVATKKSTQENQGRVPKP